MEKLVLFSVHTVFMKLPMSRLVDQSEAGFSVPQVQQCFVEHTVVIQAL